MSIDAANAIEIEGLTKRYGRHVAVNNLTMSVPQGSVFAFLGRNGAGKTTTIRILLDLLDRTKGDAKILGLDCVRDSLTIKSRIGSSSREEEAMLGRKDPQGRFFDRYVYERHVPRDHELVRIDREVDFSFVEEETRDLYEEGRGAIVASGGFV